MCKIALGICLFFSSLTVNSQEDLSKSELLRTLKKSVSDTILIDTFNELIWPIYSYDLPDSSLFYGQKAIQLATKIGDLKRLSIAHRRIGITYSNIGDLDLAIKHQEESYRLSEEINSQRGMYLALNNIGVAYLNNELLNKALSYFLRSLKYIEGTDDYANISAVYNNCGMIYRRSGDLKKSMNFFLKARHFAERSGNKDLIIGNYCNLSTANRNTGRNDSAKYYLMKAKQLLEEKTPNYTRYNYYLSEGLLFSVTGEHDKALQSLKNTEAYVTGLSDEITLLINIAAEYVYLLDTKKALEYYHRAYDLSLKNKMYDNLEFISFAIADIQEARGNVKEYVKMIKLYIAHKDSNAKMNKAQELKVQQLSFDFERKQVADSVRFEQKEKVKNMELEVAAINLSREKTYRVLLVCIIAIIILLSGFIFNRLVVSKRQNRIIESQKEIVELKNREILDSINYAKRLQEAILPQIGDIKMDLEIDILYLPKDIIGGDFYFFEKFNGHLFFAVCDCTGHGIPGAIMSVVCHQALMKSIREFNLTDPGPILDKTREIVIENLNASNQNIKDGMDCSLLVKNMSTNKVRWSGANNSLWIFEKKCMKEIKADKQPVAFYENSKSYTTHDLIVEEGSLLYLYTDGYADQFGGPKAKKYKTRSLKEFFLTITDHTVEEQVIALQENFSNWKGTLDQVDDVAIAVIKT